MKDTGTAKGRGVFALREFRDGEVVEVSPVVVLRTPYLALPQDIRELVFYWEGPLGESATQALVLGYGSLYNSNNPANMRYEVDRGARLLRFIAVRNIAAGEELTINYSGDEGAPVTDDDWWFKERKIELIVGKGAAHEE